jgi:hypothetical protein
MPATDTLYQFESPVAADFEVDAGSGVIKGISLITSGIAARGHKVDHPQDESLPEDKRRKVNLEIDKTTLEQMHACATAKGKLPVKWNHKTGADAVSGYLTNFRIVGRKLKGDWHLLKAHERYEHALELAEKMPESLGLSVSFAGKDETKGQRKFARCTELVSADLVASPAANPDGMFEVPVDSRGDGMAKPGTTSDNPADPTKEFSLADVMAGITGLRREITNLGGRLGAVEQFQSDLVEQAREFEAAGGDFEEEEEEVPREFASFGDALRHLESRLEQIVDDKERAESEAALAHFEEQVEDLMELNEQLALQNGVMAKALTELSAKSKISVAFKPGADGAGYETDFSEPEDGRAPTDFEKRVAELVRTGKCADEADATLFAVHENEGRYQRHLSSLGVIREL